MGLAQRTPALISTSRSTNFNFEVSRGRVGSHKAIIIDALLPQVNPLDGTVDVWSGGGVLQQLTSAETMELVSNDGADDKAGGFGTQTVRISGLDNDYNEIAELVNLAGASPVTTTKEYLRVFEIRQADAGTSRRNIGDLTVTASSAATLQCHCKAGKTRSQNSQYTVPLGMSLVVLAFAPNVTRTIPGALFPCVLFTAESKNAALSPDDFILRNFEVRVDAAMGHFPKVDFPVIDALSEKADIRIQCSTDTTGTEARTALFAIQYRVDIP